MQYTMEVNFKFEYLQIFKIAKTPPGYFNKTRNSCLPKKIENLVTKSLELHMYSTVYSVPGPTPLPK